MSSGGEPEEGHETGVFPLTVFLVLSIWLGHVVHCRKIAFFTEATVSLLVGLLVGGTAMAFFVWYRGQELPPALAELNTQVFFDVLLPPIIFYAGFSVKKKSFFQNFVTLFLFGVVGTFCTAALISLGASYALTAAGLSGNVTHDSLALGAIFSSSDSLAALQVLEQDAQPMLYSLVFGEGVVNDATAIVLLRAVSGISTDSQLNGATLALIALNFARLFVLSLLLGVGVGLFSAVLVKRTFAEHHSTDREVATVALLGFLAHALAEELHLSGIFAVFFAGITMSHYTWHLLSPSAKVVTVYLFRIMAFLAELAVFCYAGTSMWSTTMWESKLYTKRKLIAASSGLAAALVALVLVARALTLGPLIALANTWRPTPCRISLRQGAVIAWAGSLRGAITVAMALKVFGARGKGEPLDSQIVVVASNSAVIIFVVVLGGLTSRLLDLLLPPAELDGYASMASHPSLDHGGASAPLLASALERSLHWSKHSHVYRLWHRLDSLLYPVFGGRPPKADGAHSPPHSPGRRVIQQVMGQALAGQPRGGGAAAAASKAGVRGDAFRHWPAPSDAGAEAGEESAAVAGGVRRAARRPSMVTWASGLDPDAADTQPSGAVEELFERGSMRMDSDKSQQVEWDSTQYGEAAWLAAGAPTESVDEEAAGAALGAPPQAAEPAQGPPTLSRPSPFQGSQP